MEGDPCEGPGGARRPGWRTWLALAAGYLVVALIATYPLVGHLRTAVPGSLYDSLQHLWVLRWYRTCLFEGRAPVLCPELQYPVGAPLGNFSPLHLQAALFVPLSGLLGDDVLAYNAILLIGLATTGLGTFALARSVAGDVGAAALAGLLAMLSGPVMLHAYAPHLELVFLGSLPLFWVAWMRLLDRPSRGRLAAAAGAYLLTVASAAYYGVFAAIPAVMTLIWEALRRRRSGWVRSRAGWVLGFGAIVLPGVLLAFGNTLWAMARGYAGRRPEAEFLARSAPPWGYYTPTRLHPLGRLLGRDLYALTGHGDLIVEDASYLGVVTLALVAVAAVARPRLRKGRFWWVALGVLVVLGMGGVAEVAGRRIWLPALALRRWVFAFRMIRVASRFNLLAAVTAAVLAGAGAAALMRRLRRRGARAALLAGLALAAMLDLRLAPFALVPIPSPPACYDRIRRLDPRPTLLEAPFHPSSYLSAICGFWQSGHRMATTAGYSGVGNLPFEAGLTRSPFDTDRLGDPQYLADPGAEQFDVFPSVDARDYAWLYLTAHDLRFVVLHKWATSLADSRVRLDRFRALMGEALVFEDEATAVYDRDRLAPPRRPVLVCARGWGLATPRGARPLSGPGRLAAYIPDGRPVVFVLQAAATGRPTTVRLSRGGVELARWEVRPGPPRAVFSPPLTLPPGLGELVLEPGPARAGDHGGTSVAPVKVVAVWLRAAPAPERVAAGAGAAERP